MGALKKRCKTVGCPNLHTNVCGYCDECIKRYRETHPRVREDDRPLEVRKEYGSYRWKKFAADYLKANPVCAICGAPAKVCDHKDMPADVMTEVYGGFDYNLDHYQPLCYACNARKGRNEDKAMRSQYESDKAWIKQHDPQGEGQKK